jgi:hypothetical protein
MFLSDLPTVAGEKGGMRQTVSIYRGVQSMLRACNHATLISVCGKDVNVIARTRSLELQHLTPLARPLS